MMLRKMRHPNIISLVDSYHTIGKKELIMVIEHGVYGDLTQQIWEWKESAQPVAEVFLLKILRQIMKALQFSHSRDVFHQNLKPKNVKIMEDGTIKLGEFSSSRVLATTDGKVKS